jgi:hypothetical protein
VESVSEKFAFLSPEWEDAAEQIADGTTAPAPEGIEFTLNATITPTPYGDKLISVVVGDGQARVDKGHIDGADITVKSDYDTAYSLFIGGDMNVILSAMLEGKIVVQGDIAKLLAAAPNPAAMGSMPFLESLGEKLKSITQ